MKKICDVNFSTMLIFIKKKAKSKERCVINTESTESTESDMLQLDVCIKDSKL